MIFIYICSGMFFGALGAVVVQKYGLFLGLIDVPNERSSHIRSVPKGGGIGILFSFVIFSIILGSYKSFWIPALVLSLISLADDRYELRPVIRLFLQFLCSLVFLFFLFSSNNVGFTEWLLIVPLSFYIVGTSNFYNFMDGINGIAGITGIVGFILLALWGSINGVDPHILILCLVLAFSCLGFLPFNFPRARVFMGDIGSVLLGFVFSCMVVLMAHDLSSFICCAAFLFPFYADELSTMAIRIKDGENLAKPHRRHVYQLLANEFGIVHWKISVSYGLVQFIVGFCVIIIKPYGLVFLISILALMLMICMFFSLIVRKISR